MARLLGLEEIAPSLKHALGSVLRLCDEATVLPSAGRSAETGAFKNVAMKLSGTDAGLSPDLFSAQWFSGVSLVSVPREVAEPLLRDPAKRAAALKRLVAAIPSEMADAELQVGPELDGDESDRDKAAWTAGFDGPSCTVGLFSARQSRAPEAGLSGMDRAHSAYFLVCKAGGGVAAATFHARLTSALRKGKTLDEALEGGHEPGPAALRRVAAAAQRNRARLLAQAATALNFHTLDTISDNAAAPTAPSRGAIPLVDVSVNVLRKLPGVRSTWQYSAGCADACVSQGLVTASNVAEGFVAFTTSGGEFKLNLRNEASNCLPFTTLRLKSSRDLLQRAVEAHRRGEGHPDAEFVSERFGWLSKKLGQKREVEPLGLWGSHASEGYLASWARELGVAGCKVVRLAPELVAISALEPAKLRAVMKNLN